MTTHLENIVRDIPEYSSNLGANCDCCHDEEAKIEFPRINLLLCWSCFKENVHIKYGNAKIYV